ncbi:MAG: efflux RND transporter permease subunit [Arenicellaceae bacterium]|nr:efflux RND transporter permease subunit [Arenicellaceae bacterium]
MIEWFARNAVAANLLMVAIVMSGLITIFSRMNLEVFPDSEPDSISVSVTLRGANPEDIELGVAVRIEEAIQDLEGIDEIRSVSREGSTNVSIEVNEAYNAREMLDDVKNRIDSINTFPAEAERPVIALRERRWGVISVAVTTDYGEGETRRFAEQVREEILRMDGVSLASLDGVRAYEIAIEVSQNRLRDYGLTLASVASAIRSSSQDISAGNVRAAGGDILLRSKGQAYRYADFADIVVKTNQDGSIIRVADVAEVNDGFQEEALLTRFNGTIAAMIEIERTANEDAIEIADKIKSYVAKQQPNLPVGTSVDYWDDNSEVLKSRLSILGSSALQGGLLVIILLALFLRPSVAFWVTLGIPVTFLGAVAVLDVIGVSMNMMSLFGFIVVLGIVVDDAIVTGESVYARLRDGEDGLQASINGTKAVAIPVTFGILTTMAAFVPITQLDGRLATFFVPIPAVVIPVLFFSLIESKLILPSHLKHIKPRDINSVGRFSRWQMNFSHGFESLIINRYRPMLDKAIEYRYTVLAAFICMFFVLVTTIVTGWSRFVFIPRTESDGGQITLVMPTGTPFEVTDGYMSKIMDAGLEMQKKYTNGEGGGPIVTNILAKTGQAGRGGGGLSSNVGSVTFEGMTRSERIVNVSSTQIMNDWRKEVGEIPGAESLTFRAEFFRVGDPIDIELRGQSLEELEQAATNIKEHLATYDGVFEIADSLADGKEELRIDLTPQGHLMGLTRSDIVSQVSQAFQGFQAQRIQRGRDDIRVLVRFPLSERSTTDTLQEMLITAPNGRLVPLTTVATLTPDKGPSSITRIDLYRTMSITADVDKDTTNMTVINEQIAEYLDEFLVQYPSITALLSGEAEEQAKALGSATTSFITLLFVIYALLALPLKSYTLPLIVMSVIPFSLIGAVLGHWLMDEPLSLLSILGLLALVGVVVNDSLVLVDYVTKLRVKGKSLLEAASTAGIMRFRPVMLTSLTTFFGLMPLTLFSAGDPSAAFLKPMAISLAFGIIFATMITLVFVPINMLIARDIRNYLRRKFRGDKSTPLKTSDASAPGLGLS